MLVSFKFNLVSPMTLAMFLFVLVLSVEHRRVLYFVDCREKK